MAGPWFTVQRSSEAEWQVLDHIWVSNGEASARATVELHVEFAPVDEAAAGAVAGI
ncbi:MAG: hypothetical protein KY476_17185 [Planctomycetes bacterium]|nr:hypothetical protein [Planctomycetota bacterium]